ncbi:sensor histidine kinase [Anaeromyxobacter diazotrophicus]|uniref:histidine kinase n=1 Tax=Anaeromyxobacter diazotrophicus TaxID=2590199 RepID=A0A7I9VNN3_9BACT|nr:ATP-binding protein [Anaeromyxobacter diazotrophicus]GEJ58011.1 hypothetical protein AMYX_27520 [Anaeromyxobacter diazotrophicus]
MPLPLRNCSQASARLMTHRRRAVAVAAALVGSFLPVDLAQATGGQAAAAVRVLWVAMLLGAIPALRPERPRLAAAAGQLLGLASGAALVAIVAVTGGADGVYFNFLLALPLAVMVVSPEQPASAALASAVTTVGGAVLLWSSGHPALDLATWLLMSVAAGSLALWGTFLYLRAWATEVASEHACVWATEELARSERRRASAEKLATVGRLAAGIAHEINNPLAYAKGNVEWLAESLPAGRCPPAQLLEVLADTGRGLDHIARVVSDLQAFAREDREAPGPCAVPELVEDALRLASARVRDVADLRVEVEDGLPQVRAHARRVSQAVLNLVVNAADAVQAGGAGRDRRILVRARAAGDEVLIEVEDSGPGLSAEAAEHLFEPFFTTKGERGTGLGLVLSRENVMASGGLLEHEPAHGGGALFRIRLRSADASSGSSEPEQRAPRLGTG